MGKNAIKLDLAQCEVFNHLSPMKAGVLIKAVMSYCTTGEMASLDEDLDLKPIFMMFTAQIDEHINNRQKEREYNHSYYQKQKANSRNSRNSSLEKLEKETERDKEKVTLKEKGKEKVNEKEIYREKGGQTTLYSPKESEERMPRPTVEEVHAYAQKLGYLDFDAQHFWDFYESKGWIVGRAPMKDWKRAVVNWQRNEIQRRKEREQRQRQRPTGNSMAERAYRMVHFELENNPEGWKEEARKWEEFKKEHGL